jgi:hypothetical protein
MQVWSTVALFKDGKVKEGRAKRRERERGKFEIAIDEENEQLFPVN